MKTTVPLLFAVLCVQPAISSAQEINPDDFKSKVASRAIRAYLDRGEKAAKEFLKEKEDATEDLVEELEKALKQETTDGNLDEALKLRQTIASLENQRASNPALQSSQLVGRWKVDYGPNGIRYNDIEVRGNGFLVKRWIDPDKKLEDEGEIVIKRGDFWLSWDNGKRQERLNLSGDRLIVEHWFLPKTKDTNGFPQQFGVGEKLE